MSKQRTRLAKYLGKRQAYRATFNEIRHDEQNQPEVLLTDVYPVYADGKKVPLRSRDSLTNKLGQQIACDHLWTALNSAFLAVPFELLNGDQIQFSAVVTSYNIVRQDVIDKRNKLWQKGLAAKNKIYENYQKQVNALYKTANLAKEKAFDNYKKHLLTFKEMKQVQKEADKNRKTACRKAKQSCRHKMDRRVKKAQREIAKVEMIDYTLSDVQDVQIVKANRHFNLDVRCKYDSNRLNDLNYTRYLSAHSMYASQDRLDTWSETSVERSPKYADITS